MVTHKLIVIEGSDGSGKKTQSDILVNKLRQYNPTAKFSFPDYEGPFGKQVRHYLDGGFGDPKTFIRLSSFEGINNPGIKEAAFLGELTYIRLSALLYAADRAINLPKLQEALNKGIVVCDRYDISNLAHQGAKLEGKERRDLINWLKKLEREDVGLPIPDLVVYLNLPTEKAREAMEVQGRKLDLHEADLDYLVKVNNLYLELARKENWSIIECLKDSKRKTKEEISEEIFWAVRSIIQLE